jgi:hypothetical protein
VSVEELKPDVAPGFAALLRKMMAKRPEDRFVSAAEVQEEFRKWLSGEPALPMDQKGDIGYQHAIAVLEATEGSTDTLEPMPAEEALPPERTSSVVRVNSEPAVERPPAWVWWLMGFLGFGIVVLLVLVVVVLAS